MTPAFPRIEITPHWQAVQDDLLRVLAAVPDDKMNWSPQPDLWNFRGILLHIAAAREGWLGGIVGDGEPDINIWQAVRTKEEISRAYAATWQRLQRFLGDETQLDAEYDDRDPGAADARLVSGHWIAFHLLEHDIHHRADLLNYLALLGVAVSDISFL